MTDLAGGSDPTDAPRTAAVQFPFPADPDRVASALRGHLRLALLDRYTAEPSQPVRVLDHDSLTVEGPIQDADAGGRTWFVYLGTATTQQLRPLDPAPNPSPTPARCNADAGGQCAAS